MHSYGYPASAKRSIAAIYTESGSAVTEDLCIYHDAYGFGMLAIAIFIAVAFGVGVADLGARRRQRRSLG